MYIFAYLHVCIYIYSYLSLYHSTKIKHHSPTEAGRKHQSTSCTNMILIIFFIYDTIKKCTGKQKITIIYNDINDYWHNLVVIVATSIISMCIRISMGDMFSPLQQLMSPLGRRGFSIPCPGQTSIVHFLVPYQRWMLVGMELVWQKARN